MEDEPEPAVREGRQVPHVPLNGPDFQPFTLSNEPILGQLPGGVVQGRDGSTNGGEDRGLLASPRRQAEDFQAIQVREPVTRDRLGRGQNDLPVPTPGPGDDLRGNGNGPPVPLLYLPVPSVAVVF